MRHWFECLVHRIHRHRRREAFHRIFEIHLRSPEAPGKYHLNPGWKLRRDATPLRWLLHLYVVTVWIFNSTTWSHHVIPWSARDAIARKCLRRRRFLQPSALCSFPDGLSHELLHYLLLSGTDCRYILERLPHQGHRAKAYCCDEEKRLRARSEREWIVSRTIPASTQWRSRWWRRWTVHRGYVRRSSIHTSTHPRDTLPTWQD